MRIADEHKAKLYKVNQASPTQEPDSTSAEAVLVQFNPTSLSYLVQNTLEKKGRDANAKQFVSQTTATLEFELVFDSTHDGADVRAETDRIKQFLKPGERSCNKDQAPPLVGFRWGTLVFKGIVESFNEVLDFFSSEGVPLRSSLTISLASQDPKDVFAALPPGHPDATVGGSVSLAIVPPRGTSAMASQGGNPGAGRALAAANGFENMRSPGVSVAAVVGGGIALKAAASFSTGASAGIGIGIGIGVGAGLGAAAGGGAASLQAFAGLGASKTPSTACINAAALQVGAPSAATSVGSQFALGGKVSGAASSGMKADMGSGARIKFD